MILLPTLRSLPSGQHAVAHGDDIALGARSAKEADGLLIALKEALKSHPAGPFRLRYEKIESVASRFDYLKYRYKAVPEMYGGGIRRVPSQQSYRRFEERVTGRTLEALEAGVDGDVMDHRIEIYAVNWANSFCRWEPSQQALLSLEGTMMMGQFAAYAIMRGRKGSKNQEG